MSIVIETGLFEGMVFCQNASKVSEQHVTGSCEASGEVLVAIDNGGFQPCGQAVDGRFTADICGLPVRLDPYSIRLKIGDEQLEFTKIWVGDVWALGGQSNMQGSADMKGVYINDNPAVRAYYMDDRWDVANDPLHVLPTANACVHWNLMGRTEKWKGPYEDPLDKGAGPGVSFGVQLLKATGVPQGLLCCAHGGSNMEQWSPELRDDGDASLYGAMLNRIRRNGGRVSGIIWYQGESDATNDMGANFRQNMENFLAALASDLKDDKVLFVQMQLARIIDNSSPIDHWNKIQYDQMALADEHPNVVTVPTVDMEMGDTAHISTEGYKELGRRIAYAICAYRRLPGYAPEIRPVSAKLDRLRRTNVERITVKFANVVGELQSVGPVRGFTINHLQQVVRCVLKGDTVEIYCPLSAGRGTLEYGNGRYPFCNVRDGAGRSLPSCQLAIEPNFVDTGYPEQMRVTDPILMDDDVDKITYDQIPEDDGTDSLYYTQKRSGSFILFRNRLQTPHQPGFRFLRARYLAKKPLKLTMLAGYDAPTAIFFDGKKVHANPNGLNPVIPHEFAIETDWTPGEHEVVFAEVLHDGNAFGMSLCFEAPNGTDPADLPVLLTK